MQLISTSRISWTVVALVAIALFAAGCGGSSDRSASTGAKQVAPPAAAAHSPMSKATEVSPAATRKMLAKARSKALRHVDREAEKSPGKRLAQAVRKGIAREIVRGLAAARKGHGSPVSHRLKKAIARILARRNGNAKGGAGSPSPAPTAQVVREILRRSEEAK